MSNQKYTPMQILQDNIKQKINQLEGHEQVRWIAEMEAYRAVLDMIQGDSLGKPLLEQEAELLGIKTELKEELPKKGQVVWVRDDYDEGWIIAHFSHKEDEFYRASILCNDKIPPCWKFLTTKNPYEVEEDREPQIGDMVFAWNEENFSDLTHDIYVSYGTGIKRVYKVGNKVFKHCSLKNPLIK